MPRGSGIYEDEPPKQGRRSVPDTEGGQDEGGEDPAPDVPISERGLEPPD
jgi:hypothetical protein